MKTEHGLPIYDLIVEIRGAFNDLKALSDQMNDDLGVTAAMRAVLEFLHRNGPHTVPQIAEAKNVSRQHIQLLADALEARSLVIFAENPRHKRSRLVAMTPDGVAIFDRIAGREADALRDLAGRIDAGQITAATATVRRLRHLVSEARDA